MTTLDVMEWLRERTERRIANYREYLAEHPVPHYMTTEEHDKVTTVTTVIEILEDILEEIESADRALRPWMQPGELVDFHFDMGSDEVTNPGLRVLGEVRDHCGSLCVRVKEGLVCVRALTQAGGAVMSMTRPTPPLMLCPECGTLLEVHQDSGRIVCPHCGYEESEGVP